MIIKTIITVLLSFTLLGCGFVDRKFAEMSGKPTEVCYDNVIYLQFTSGVIVKYNQTGEVALCQ
jgi:hypothetical protein